MSSHLITPAPQLLTEYDKFCAGLIVVSVIGTNDYLACRNETVYFQSLAQDGKLYLNRWQEFMNLEQFEKENPLVLHDLKTDYL